MPRYRMREDYYDPGYVKSQRERLQTKAEMVYEAKKKVAIEKAQAEAQRAYAQTRLRWQKKVDVLEEQRERTRYYETVAASPEFKESIAFYTSIGYPLHAGKYEPFAIPEGQKVEAIKQTEKGLEVAFKSTAPEPQKGIAETILGWDMPVYKGPSLLDIISPRTKLLPQTATASEFGRIAGITVHPLSPIAAPIAAVERPVYSLAPLVGIPAPRPPPTFVGGVIGKGFQAGLGWKSTELEETMAYGPQYAVGTILGDVLLSMAMGKVWQKTAGKVIAKKTESWLTTKYMEKGPLAWKGWPEKAVMKVTGARPYLPSGVVSFPSMEKIGLKGLAAQELAWQLSLTPKTSLVTITKVGAKRTVFRFMRGVGYTPMAVTLAKAMSVKEMGGRQALLVIQKPLRGKLPYLPSLIFKEPITRLPQLLGFGLTFGLKGVPSLVSLPSLVITEKLKHRKKMELLVFPQLLPKATPITRLTPFISPITRAKERLIPILTPIQSQIVKQTTIQQTMLKQETMLQQLTIQETMLKQVQIQKLQQLQIQKVMMAPPRLTQITTIKPPRFQLPHVSRDVSRGRGLWGRWFKREHRIKTPEEMARTFFGEPKPRRKKRSKTKRATKKRRKSGKRVKKKGGKRKK